MDLYTVLAAGFRLGWRLLDLDVRSVGHDNIPARGPAILASNHIGYLDFCFVALTPPRPRRQVRFLARHDIFERPVVGWAMRTMRQIPVDVHGDPAGSLAEAERRLREGEVVGIHPESTISPSFVPRTGRSGAVRLAQAAGAPIIPVAIWGSHRLLTKWRPERFTRHVAVTVRYGEPYHPPSAAEPGAATTELMERIDELLAKSQAAYPQRPGPGAGDDWWVPAHLGGSAPTPEAAERRLREQAEERRRRAEAEGRAGRGEPPDAAPPSGG